MSKAFTRESDADQQGDLLPERTIPPHPNLVTADGLAQIEDAITHLTNRQHEVRAEGEIAATASIGRDLRYWSAKAAAAQRDVGGIVVEPLLDALQDGFVSQRLTRRSLPVQHLCLITQVTQSFVQ